MKRPIEIRCGHDLALQLGAIIPETMDHHRQLRDSGRHFLMRDNVTALPMFWAMLPDLAQILPKSS